MEFEKFGLKKELLESIKKMGYTSATGIQEKGIPLINSGKDVIGLSLTGSGKTAAFALPILNNLIKGQKEQVLVLVPTRELAEQVKESFDNLGKYIGARTVSVYGGVGYDYQMRNIPISEIIVATPGRLLDHINQGTIVLKNIRVVILDEADRMLDMGFEKDINKILQCTPKDRQTLMFSATMPAGAKSIAQRYQKSPVLIQEKMHVDTSLLRQVFYQVPKNEKFSLLLHLLKNAKGTAIIFCRTKREVDRVSKNIQKQGLEAGAVHGDIPQSKRQRAVNAFKEGHLDVLVATDIAARGLDIKNVSHVYNYDVPRDPDDYTHRIGRTARAGAEGDAVTLVTEVDYREFGSVLRRHHIKELALPEFEIIQIPKHEMTSHMERGGRFGGRREQGRGYGRDFGGNQAHPSRSFGGHSRGPKRFGQSRGSYGNDRGYGGGYSRRSSSSYAGSYEAQSRNILSKTYDDRDDASTSQPRPTHAHHTSSYSEPKPSHGHNFSPEKTHTPYEKRGRFSKSKSRGDSPRNKFSPKRGFSRPKRKSNSE